MFFLNSYIKINAAVLAIFLAFIGLFSYFSGEDDIAVINSSGGVRLPIIMYHSVLKDDNLSGKYVITPSELESDIEYLHSQGFSFVSMREVIAFCEEGAPLPEKPAILTFDDGCYNNYGYVLPILKKYDAKAVFCVVGEYTDKYSEENIANMTYGYMRWSEISELEKSPYAEVANHSYGFHHNNGARNGSKRKRGESSREYCRIFRADTEKAQSRFEQNCGFRPYIYAYPFGAYSEESFDILENMGFKATLSCNEGINFITQGGSLYLLKRFNRPSGITSEAFFESVYKDLI